MPTNIWTPLLSLILLKSVIVADEICCCPDFTVSLKCEDRRSESIQTSFLKANGYVCDALDGTDVTLVCEVADINEAVKEVKYSYYKAKDLGYKPVAYDINNSKKLTECDVTKGTCVLSSVKWSGAADSPTKFENFDNYLYQCNVQITLIDNTVFELTSNTMLLDVYKNKDVPDNYEIVKENKGPLNTNNGYERLNCGVGGLPFTNPRTTAKWSFKRLEDSEWTELNILSEQPRMAIVEPVIAADSAGSFTEGTLVLMMFNPAEDTGYYMCEAEYTTTTVGRNQTYTRAEYKVTGNNQQNNGNPETKMLSAITSKSYTLKDEFVYFNCYARDTDASEQGRFRWVYENASDFVVVDTSTELFRDVEIINYNRTLKLPSYYKYYNFKFKCEVSRESEVNSVLSNEFTQPVVVPQEMYIPLTSKACSKPDSEINLFSSTKYMMSDGTDVEDFEQKLTGASHRWMINSKMITPFSNPTSEGGVTTEQQLRMTADVFNRTVRDSKENKCQYFTFLQTRSKGYQLHEVLKMTRTADSCQDLPDCTAVTLFRDCTDNSLSVSLAGGSPQCVSVEVFKGNKSIFKRAYPKVAPSCSERILNMTITKEDLEEEVLQGIYEVRVAPERKQGCTKFINFDAEAAAYCIEKPEEEPTVDEEETNSGPVERVASCPQEYFDETDKTPWTINASKTCEVKVTELGKLGVEPTDGACYEVSFVKSSTDSMFQKICDLEIPLKNLSHDSYYELQWKGFSNQSQCKSQIRVACNSSEGLHSPLLLVVLLILATGIVLS
ncbi:uncharacterized protein LOC134819290 isoform X2 [Bolinopsis microptera]|uniref:uncharacterized protein LOC134819290 isoform X2 n=1 Tax=Bolinopsis microptera TaxID=2820187 RepID=UPI00307AEA45